MFFIVWGTRVFGSADHFTHERLGPLSVSVLAFHLMFVPLTPTRTLISLPGNRCIDVGHLNVGATGRTMALTFARSALAVTAILTACFAIAFGGDDVPNRQAAGGFGAIALASVLACIGALVWKPKAPEHARLAYCNIIDGMFLPPRQQVQAVRFIRASDSSRSTDDQEEGASAPPGVVVDL